MSLSLSLTLHSPLSLNRHKTSVLRSRFIKITLRYPICLAFYIPFIYIWLTISTGVSIYMWYWYWFNFLNCFAVATGCTDKGKKAQKQQQQQQQPVTVVCYTLNRQFVYDIMCVPQSSTVRVRHTENNRNWQYFLVFL